MRDQWGLLATQLADGTGVSSGDRVSIFLTDVSAISAVEAFVEEVYSRGAEPAVILSDERFDRLAIKYLPDESLVSAPAIEMLAMEWSSVHVSFRAMVPPAAGVDPHRAALLRRGKGLVSDARWRRTRWALVRIPTPEWASMIGTDYESLMAQFFAGSVTDWEHCRKTQRELCDALDAATWVRVQSEDTDLSFGTAGRRWVSFAGEANLPDGEVATAPVDSEVNGYITFPGTQWFAGVPISDLRLEFSDGVVAAASASEGHEFVDTLLDTDEGARRVGELGIGTNPAITMVTGDLFLDEKILGSMHLALGRAYPECGGVNESAIHWDIVKDLRTQNGTLSSDVGQLITDGTMGPLLQPFIA